MKLVFGSYGVFFILFIFFGALSTRGRHGGAVVSAAAAQQEGPEFDSPSRQGLSVRSLHVLLASAWVLSGYSGFRSG